MLVVDASVAIYAATAEPGLRWLADRELVAPPLMWPEARSVLHAAVWRNDLPKADAEAAMRWLDAGPIRSRNPRQLGREAWRLADALGWAKTYDAEYLALAQLLGCRVVTLDGALQRGAARLELVVGLHQL